MLVCIPRELENITSELQQKGYTITTESNIPCDAIICRLKDISTAEINIQSYIKREGTLIIDVGSKNSEEIEYILNTRVYTSLM